MDKSLVFFFWLTMYKEGRDFFINCKICTIYDDDDDGGGGVGGVGEDMTSFTIWTAKHPNIRINATVTGPCVYSSHCCY